MGKRVPEYRRHKASGQAVVTLDGRDHYLGKYGTPESKAKYKRVTGEWLLNGRRLPPTNDLTNNELAVHFLHYCDGYYRKPDGRPTDEAKQFLYSLRPLVALYGSERANDFTIAKLKHCRQTMIDRKFVYRQINKRVRRIVGAFKWAASEGLVPASLVYSLSLLIPLKRGRSEAAPGKKVRAVPLEQVRAVLPHVLPAVAAAIRLQYLTGMRSSEVLSMRTADIDRRKSPWTYRPESHKTEHHDQDRIVRLGPKCQKLLLKWLRDEEPNSPIFSPRREMEKRSQSLRANRKSKVQPSQMRRRKTVPAKVPGERYSPGSYGRAIRRACVVAKVPHWHPHQLRHSAATRIRAKHGLEVACILLGHRSLAVTDGYAERNARTAIEAALKSC